MVRMILNASSKQDNAAAIIMSHWCRSTRSMALFLCLVCSAAVWYINRETISYPTSESLMTSSSQASKKSIAIAECLESLPEWTKSPENLKSAIFNGSKGLTDKTTLHRYHVMYHRYLSPLAMRACFQPETPLRVLEIGLGCASNGGMLKHTPGGSALAWRHLFGSRIDLHSMEFDEECALKWNMTNSHMSTVHTGDASSESDLSRVYNEAGSQPFDLIIDDASHLNEHQIKTLDLMFPRIAPAGVYVIEDIHSSCYDWKVNAGIKPGKYKRVRVGGTEDCITTTNGAPTIYGKIVEWQKLLVKNQIPFPEVNHIDVCLESAVFTKAAL